MSSAKGYKQGGFNLGTGLSDTPFSNDINYQPESLINYELGLNKYFSLSSTYLDLVLFFSDRKDQQVLISTQVDPQDPNTFLYLTRNASEGLNYGAEMSLKKEFSDNFSIFIDVGLLKTEIRNYASRPDLEGREQAHAPSYSFSSGLRWNITNDLEFLLDVTGKNNFYYSDSHDNQSDDYVLTNLNVVYTRGKLRYNFWTKNLFDKYYSLRGFYFGNEAPNFEDALYERHGDPRNLGLSIQYEF
jgi:iron complex outermembrane receptor protein